MFLRVNKIQKRREKLIVPAFLVYYPPMIREKSTHHLSLINLFKQCQKKTVKCYDCTKRMKKYLVYILNISTDSQLGCTNYASENAYFSALLFLLKGKVL